jgi:molybdopterin molybdotransferase
VSEPDVSDLLTVAQAIAILDAAEVHPRVAEIPLADADGLVLAEDVRADRDYPPFDRSLMDGYAVHTADTANVPVDLEVVGEIPAGAPSARGFANQQTVAIMTGAPLPDGADGVVPVEDVQKLTPSPPYSGERAGEREQMRIRVLRASAPGRFIARRGSDVRAGEVVLKNGTRLGPPQLAALATVGASKISAFTKPQAAVLSTGNEIVNYDQAPTGSQIRNSNSLMLISLLKRLGCDVADLGAVRDERDAVRDALRNGMNFNLLFVTGGMSMGEYDFVPRTLAELGAELKITKLRIKPGKPFVFAQNDDRHIFGLPGNPVSAFVCTVRLASRLIARLRGEQPRENWIHASLSEPLPANGPREFYQPVFCRDGVAQPLKWKGSADVFTLAAANGLLVRKENEPPLAAGALMRVLQV